MTVISGAVALLLMGCVISLFRRKIRWDADRGNPSTILDTVVDVQRKAVVSIVHGWIGLIVEASMATADFKLKLVTKDGRQVYSHQGSDLVSVPLSQATGELVLEISSATAAHVRVKSVITPSDTVN